MYIISLSPYFHALFPPFSPSLISLMVSLDAKRHVYVNIRRVPPGVKKKKKKKKKNSVSIDTT